MTVSTKSRGRSAASSAAPALPKKALFSSRKRRLTPSLNTVAATYLVEAQLPANKVQRKLVECGSDTLPQVADKACHIQRRNAGPYGPLNWLTRVGKQETFLYTRVTIIACCGVPLNMEQALGKAVIAASGSAFVTDHLQPVVDWLKAQGYTPTTGDAFGLTPKALGLYGFAQPLNPDALAAQFEFPPSILVTLYGIHDVANYLSIRQYCGTEPLLSLEAERQALAQLTAGGRALANQTEIYRNAEWRRGLQGSIRESARAHRSSLTYQEQDRIWREYPASGELYEVTPDWETMILRSVHGVAVVNAEPKRFLRTWHTAAEQVRAAE